MGTILYNGDSFTYGDELNGYPNTHGRHTFAEKLSNTLEYKYINIAQNGSSNQKIYRTTQNFLQQTQKKIDLVIITWSNFGRFELCEDFTLDGDSEIDIGKETDMNQIIASHHSDKFGWYNKDSSMPKERHRILGEYINSVWTMQTAIVHQMSYMNNIQFLCDQMGIGVIQGVIHPHMWHNVLQCFKGDGYKDYKESVATSLEQLRPECRIGLGKYETIYAMADKNNTLKPRGHACEQSHSQYALQLYNIIKERNVSH